MSFVNELLNDMTFQTKTTKNDLWDVVKESRFCLSGWLIYRDTIIIWIQWHSSRAEACYFRFHGPHADNKVRQAILTGTVKDTLSSGISKKFKSFHTNEIWHGKSRKSMKENRGRSPTTQNDWYCNWLWLPVPTRKRFLWLRYVRTLQPPWKVWLFHKPLFLQVWIISMRPFRMVALLVKTLLSHPLFIGNVFLQVNNDIEKSSALAKMQESN